MKYDLSKKPQLEMAKELFAKLIENKNVIELKKSPKTHTVSQINYVHVLFNLFGCHFGYTKEESKTHLKRNCPFMVYEKVVNNKTEKFLVTLSSIDDVLMSKFIEWVRTYSAQQGCYLPSSEEYLAEKMFFDNHIDRHSEFL